MVPPGHRERRARDRAWRLAEEFSAPVRRPLLPRAPAPRDSRRRTEVNAELIRMGVRHADPPAWPPTTPTTWRTCDHEHHDALLCIGTAANLDDREASSGSTATASTSRTATQMREVFHDHPSGRGRHARDRRALPASRSPCGTYHMPEYQVPAGKTRDQVMEEQAWARAEAATSAWSPTSRFDPKGLRTSYIDAHASTSSASSGTWASRATS